MVGQEEIWKDVVGFKGLYQVSNFGRVKSLERHVKRNSITLRINNERILKPSVSSAGYYIVSLCDSIKCKTRAVHKLVAEAFLGHVPSGYFYVINHKDFIRTNNKLDNLEIVTTRENANQKHLKSISKYVGVCWHKHTKKWCSRIVVKGKRISLGYFVLEIEAHTAYQNALKNI